jgi:hypothetical protein
VSNLIDFLEQLGRDAELRYATTEMMEDALRGAGIEPALRAAILEKDERALNALMDAEPNVCCAVFKEDEEEEEDTEDEKEDESEEDEEAVLDVKMR